MECRHQDRNVYSSTVLVSFDITDVLLLCVCILQTALTHRSDYNYISLLLHVDILIVTKLYSWFSLHASDLHLFR